MKVLLRVRAIFVAFAWAAMLGTALAQTPEEVVRWIAEGPATAKPGALLQIGLKAVIQEEWHVYSISQMPGGPTRTVISVPDHQPFERDGSLKAPLPHTAFDPNFNIDTETYEGTVQLKLPVRVAKSVPAGAQKIAVDILFQTCNDTTCLPPHTTHLFVPVKIEAAAAAGVTAAPSIATPAAPAVPVAPATVTTASPAANGAAPPSAPISGPTAQVLSQHSLGSFIWLAMVMGALSLLTPCVFPMIPITVS
ncbi:MAG TPA: protein-disulfide reductase DsbD domain-containing protein, partial [Candidatus Koribacter sp.]